MATIIGDGNDDHLIGTNGIDFMGGLGGNDTIEGLGGDDIINGGEGDDVIEGVAGGDFLLGSIGIDTLSYATSNAAVFIALGDNGEIEAADGGHAEGDSGNGFENITGSAFADLLIGNDLANVSPGSPGTTCWWDLRATTRCLAAAAVTGCWAAWAPTFSMAVPALIRASISTATPA